MGGVGREKRARGLQRIEESETKVSLSPQPNPLPHLRFSLASASLAREPRGGRRRNPRIRARLGGRATRTAPSGLGAAGQAPGRADRAPGGLPPPPPCHTLGRRRGIAADVSTNAADIRNEVAGRASPLPWRVSVLLNTSSIVLTEGIGVFYSPYKSDHSGPQNSNTHVKHLL